MRSSRYSDRTGLGAVLHRRLDGLRTGGFRTVELNIVGWAVLVGVGAVVGLALWIVGVTLALAVPAGILGVWLVAVAVDWFRHRESLTTVRSGDDETVHMVAERAGAAGIPVEVVQRNPHDIDAGITIQVKHKYMRRLDEIARGFRRGGSVES